MPGWRGWRCRRAVRSPGSRVQAPGSGKQRRGGLPAGGDGRVSSSARQPARAEGDRWTHPSLPGLLRLLLTEVGDDALASLTQREITPRARPEPALELVPGVPVARLRRDE